MNSQSGLSLVEVLISMALLAVAGMSLIGFIAHVSDLDHLARLRLKAGMLAMDEYTSMVGTRPQANSVRTTSLNWGHWHYGRQVSTTFRVQCAAERTAPKRDIYKVTVSWKDSAGPHQSTIEGVRVVQ